MSKHIYNYLALGDSYTIGESVPLHESYPYQTVQLLRQQGLKIHAPEIVAQTGWTSSELATHLLHIRLEEAYNFVSLLIGVNNQYRGEPVADFEKDFVYLLQKAIHLTGNQPEKVIVLSIPDWGVTAYGENSNRAAIGKEIDTFNEVCHRYSGQMHTHFIDITTPTRSLGKDASALAKDGLHYSGKTHAGWAKELSGYLASIMQQ